MTALVLRWRRSDPPVVTRWAGADATVSALAAADPPRPIAAVIGPPGPAGASVATRVAGEPLGGHRAVAVRSDGRAYHVSPGDALIAVFGLTTGAAGAGAAATIQSAGEMTEPVWNWSQGPVYLGANGTLTQVVPMSGAVVELGVAGGPTSITINPRVVAKL